jgi:hypothetical protein
MFVRKVHTIEGNQSYDFNKTWTKLKESEAESLRELIKILLKSKTGKKIVGMANEKAKAYSKPLLELILPGEGSITDTTLVRKFSPSSPDDIFYESRSKVFINRHLSVKNALLDLAHELTHFALRDPFNPYQAPFGLKDFITSTVEGKGGEVDAYLIECQVLVELFQDQVDGSNCHRVIDPSTGRVNKSRGVHEFYQLGHFYGPFQNSLKKHDLNPKEFSVSSSRSAHFISSAYGLPYPLAAVHEYESIMERVCQNDDRRLALMRQRVQRSPASSEQNNYRKLASLHKKRCESFSF